MVETTTKKIKAKIKKKIKVKTKEKTKEKTVVAKATTIQLEMTIKVKGLNLIKTMNQ